MFKITQAAHDLITLGQNWCVVTGDLEDKSVVSVHINRKAAREAVNGHPEYKVTQLNGNVEFQIVEAVLTVNDPHGILKSDMEDDAAEALAGAGEDDKTASDKAFDQPHHGHMDDSISGVVENLQAVGLNPIVIDENTDFKTVFPQGTVEAGVAPQDVTIGEGNETRSAQDASEFAAAKAAEVVVPADTVKPINPTAEAAPKKAKEIRRESETEKPTKLVWLIADTMIAANPATTRKEIIAACDARKIAYSTVRTQLYHWNKQNNHFKAA